MPLGTEVGLGPDATVLDGDPTPLPKKGSEPPPQFSTHVYCGQTAGWIKMALGMEVGLGPGHTVLDGDPASVPKKGAKHFIFRPFLLWPNGWMHQDATWYGGRPQPRRLCVFDGDPCTPRKRAHAPHPIFGPCLLWPNGGWIKMPLGTEVGLDPFRPCLLWPNSWMDQDITL